MITANEGLLLGIYSALIILLLSSIYRLLDNVGICVSNYQRLYK